MFEFDGGIERPKTSRISRVAALIGLVGPPPQKNIWNLTSHPLLIIGVTSYASRLSSNFFFFANQDKILSLIKIKTVSHPCLFNIGRERFLVKKINVCTNLAKQVSYTISFLINSIKKKKTQLLKFLIKRQTSWQKGAIARGV